MAHCLQVLELGFNVLHCDVDFVWFRDPLQYILGLGNSASPDLMISSDKVSTENRPEAIAGFEVGANSHTNLNTGIYFVRHSEGKQEWLEVNNLPLNTNLDP